MTTSETTTLEDALLAAQTRPEALRIEVGCTYQAKNEAVILIVRKLGNGKYAGRYSPQAGAWVPVSYNHDGSCAHIYSDAHEWNLIAEI